MSVPFPFTAIVGMERAKSSMLCHAIDPHLGGLILLGHRGCAKSTLARAFAQALPPFEGDDAPFVEVPLGATEDRLLGSMDAASLLEKGKWSSRIGLIQQAHRGVLYIDEINLMPDHLSDSILDSAASGTHRIERDGISSEVAAHYILIGSMNPEEGDLRPQLLDRFSHGILISDDYSVEERMTIVERRMAFDDNQTAFNGSYQSALDILKKQILQARRRLPSLHIPHTLRRDIAQTARDLKMEGVRAELAALRTSRCLAAWEGRQNVEAEDVDAAWILCLGHRQRENRKPPHAPPRIKEKLSNSAPRSGVSPPVALKTSMAPLESRWDNLKLRAAEPRGYEILEAWWQTDLPSSGSHKQSNNSTGAIGGIEYADSRICWFNSFLASVKQGWKPGSRNWQMRFHYPTRKANVWIFLDASRSTAALRFLAEARNVLLSFSPLARACRFHILLLRDSRPSWLLRRGTIRQTESALFALNEAGGKSHLAQCLQQLIRGIQRQGVGAGDRILICSDGLTSPQPGESAQKALQTFRHALRQLAHFGIPVAWLHPAPKHGQARWIPRLIDNLPIVPVSLEPEKKY